MYETHHISAGISSRESRGNTKPPRIKVSPQKKRIWNVFMKSSREEPRGKRILRMISVTRVRNIRKDEMTSLRRRTKRSRRRTSRSRRRKSRRRMVIRKGWVREALVKPTMSIKKDNEYEGSYQARRRRRRRRRRRIGVRDSQAFYDIKPSPWWLWLR